MGRTIKDGSEKDYIQDQLTTSFYNSEGNSYKVAGTNNLQTWFNKLEDIKTTPLDILVIGDSILGTLFNTTAVGDSLTWDFEHAPTKLGRLFNKRMSVTTDPERAFIVAKGDGTTPEFTTNLGANPSPLISWGFGYWASENEDGEDATIVHNMTHISIIYGKHSLGGEIVVRDGGPAGTILTTISTVGTEKSSFKWTSNNIGYGAHTIYLEINCDPGETVRLEGAYVHINFATGSNEPYGVRVWNAAHGGAGTNYYTANPEIYRDFMDNNPVDLVIVGTGTNDSVGTIQGYMEALYAQIQAQDPTVPIIAWIPPVSTGMSEPERDLVKAAAEAYDVTWIDANYTFGALGQTGNVLNHDGLHPNRHGRLEIARQIHRVASGNPLTSLAQSVSQLAPLSKPQFDNIAVATTIYANIISGGIGRVMTGQFFGYPYWQQKLVDTDVNPAIQIASAGFNNFSYTLNYVGILMGAGGATAPDVNLYRSAANVLKTDDTLDAAGLKVASLTGVLRADSGVVSAPTSQQLLNTGRATFNTTAAETSLLASAFNLAAGTLVNNGDRLNIKLSYWQKNNTGSAVTFLHKLKVGGNSATVVNSYSQ
jgi:hypothetical protein